MATEILQECGRVWLAPMRLLEVIFMCSKNEQGQLQVKSLESLKLTYRHGWLVFLEDDQSDGESWLDQRQVLGSARHEIRFVGPAA